MRHSAILAAVAILPLLLLGWAGNAPAGTAPFVRGDCNDDGSFDIADPILTLSILFGGAPPANCDDACDSNDDGALDIADPVYSLGTLFNSGPPPDAPFPGCGIDPTPDLLACAVFVSCDTGPLSHAADIQPIWSKHCIVCHSGPMPPMGLLLDDAFGNIVGVPAVELPAMNRISPGDPDNSYLWHKINGTQVGLMPCTLPGGDCGSQMPPPLPFTIPLEPEDLILIEQWILEGANP
ncbi:MAG: hypothetical protein ACE5GW_05395 [Planctomycetota bacterium]